MGFISLPPWMQSLVRELLCGDLPAAAAKTSQSYQGTNPATTRRRSAKYI